MADDDDDDGGGLSRRTLIAALAYVGLLIIDGLLVVLPTLGDDDSASDSPQQLAAADAAGGGGGDEPPSEGDDPAGGGPASSEVQVTETPTTVPETTEPPDTEPARAAPATTEPATIEPARTTTTARPTTTTAPPPPYETLPDGTPVPVVAIFNGPEITLTGAVPSQAAVERLSALALANSKVPATVVNQLTINPAVPITVGVRVIEMQSARFPEGSATVTPEHGVELDRVVTVMNALPNITALVIGHADQRGDELANFVLSEDRARAVTTYLAAKGIAPTRLSSRAVGESELLSLGNDAAAFALNRRTEFVFYGLLVE